MRNQVSGVTFKRGNNIISSVALESDFKSKKITHDDDDDDDDDDDMESAEPGFWNMSHIRNLRQLQGTFILCFDFGGPCGQKRLCFTTRHVVKILIWLACTFVLEASERKTQLIFNTIFLF